MDIRENNQQLSFAGALNADDIAWLKQQGYQRVINNRHENEEQSPLSHQQERALVRQSGMEYVSLPFNWDSLTLDDIFAFHHLLRQDKKTLAHCRSGARSASLFLLYELHTGQIDEGRFRQRCQQTGGDAERALTWYGGIGKTEAQAEVHPFYEPESGSLQYVIADAAARRCAIIDPVLDFDRNSASVSYQQAQRILDFIAQRQWRVSWVLDTHPHADHFSAAAWLAQQTGALKGIGEKVTEVQALWQKLYHLSDIPEPHTLWDALFSDGDPFYVGNLRAEVLLSPGHTLASVTYHIADCAFIHDTLFMPDSGTARTDFPGGSAAALWQSVQRILQLPQHTRLFTGHDYRPGGREMQCESTLSQQLSSNPWLAGQNEASFIARREQRDATLPLPDLMLMALQINIRGGELPDPEADGERYLKIPLNRFRREA
ncbi:bifunctional sulfur transferase/dioxygenase Blh [Erwinia mallotivora]|uniref:bifunctional sulfur transferase/dioxygenase Blh n=1 Tax=Erwinia mallotivora TaxID=69222 RepID=UPI0021BEC7C4|nr:bifunctional sulfur transferase/dioxygenase Blh [Erwinia mallotivora]